MCGQVPLETVRWQDVLPHQLTGNYYQDFLLYDLSKLMEDAHHRCMHDIWTGRGGPTSLHNVAVYDGTCQGIQWLPCRILSAFIIKVLFPYNLEIKSFQKHVDMNFYSSFGIWNSSPHHPIILCVHISSFGSTRLRYYEEMSQPSTVVTLSKALWRHKGINTSTCPTYQQGPICEQTTTKVTAVSWI
jgi:hypothetical protein